MLQIGKISHGKENTSAVHHFSLEYGYSLFIGISGIPHLCGFNCINSLRHCSLQRIDHSNLRLRVILQNDLSGVAGRIIRTAQSIGDGHTDDRTSFFYMRQKSICKILNGRKRRLWIDIRFLYHAFINIANINLINLLLIVLSIKRYIKRYYLNIVFLS